MTITAPTKITIEVHPATGPGADGSAGAAVIRVIPEPLLDVDATRHDGSPRLASQPVVERAPVAPRVVAAESRIEQPVPAAYDPGECRCLDDEDCAADHANE
ncbi:MAG TPA: hypothetical protein VNL94_01770 [Candidatus Binatia bacterium]|nr:hypothetical protein [Candidatus Binatia bacterium]